MKKENTKAKVTSIGGSALIEGIMMRGPKKTTVAVRMGKDNIYTEDMEVKSIASKFSIFKLPFIRGVAGLIDSMRLSYKALMLSADKAMEAEENLEDEESNKIKKIEDKENTETEKLETVVEKIEETEYNTTENLTSKENEELEVTVEKLEKTKHNDVKNINKIENTEINPVIEEKKENEKSNDTLMAVLMVLSTLVGIAIAVGLFFFLPTFLFDLSSKVIPAFQGTGGSVVFYKSVFEGILKIVLFLGYIILTSQLSDMRRVFMYHGAEHKTIACYEAGEKLTPENIKKYSRFHPRCGTSFMVYMLLLGIIVGLFIPVAPFGISALRPIIKLLLLPVTCGLGYELLRVVSRHDNALTRAIAKPGIWAQRITTKEPDEGMLEVAVAAMTSVIPDDGTDLVES